VHSEKPLALRYDEARELVELAAAQGVQLACAPTTLLGEAQQTAWKLVREHALGTIRVVYAEANWGRIESWHPEPGALYAVGPHVDVGVYPLTIATAMLGPVRRVSAYGAVVEPERVTLAGERFGLETPDLVVALLELESCVVVRLTASFYVGPSKQRGLELHGDIGSLYLATWGEADSRLELQQRGGEYGSIPLVREPYDGIDWGRSLVDLAEAVEQGRRPRASGEHAAHVVEALGAVERAISERGSVEVRSTFEPPEPMEWAR
jgi:predicted dehydrogenase